MMHPLHASCVVISQLDPRGAFAQHGLKVGDAISHVNGCNLSSLNGSRDASVLLQDLWSELDPADPDHAEISLSLVEATRDAMLRSSSLARLRSWD